VPALRLTLFMAKSWLMISSPNNARVKYVRRLQVDRRFRDREQAFAVEGTRWLSEVVLSRQQPQLVLATAAWLEANRGLADKLQNPAQVVDDRIMSHMSETETPAGIITVVPIAPNHLPEHPTLLLILDQIANPGNLGTMLRTAAAAGIDGVLLAPGCVDAYNPKAVRGGMGAHLRLPVRQATWSEIERLTAGLRVWVAAAGGQVSYDEVAWREPSALIIGSEAHGASRTALSLAQEREVRIPLQRATESLNAAVASGIILFEAARQRASGRESKVGSEARSSNGTED
jgi:TrmH family RNA methyltransferase